MFVKKITKKKNKYYCKFYKESLVFNFLKLQTYTKYFNINFCDIFHYTYIIFNVVLSLNILLVVSVIFLPHNIY